MTEYVQQLPVIAWIWNSQAPPPTSGQLRTDSRNWVGAQVLHFDRRSETGSDMSTVLDQIKSGDSIHIEHHTEPARYALYSVTSALRVGDVFQYGVTYKSGGGTLPNSGTRILANVTISPPSEQALYWEITPAREPNRFWIVCYCAHGQLVETVATQLGPPAAARVIPTTALNLLRRTACNCTQITPPVSP